MAMNRPRPTPMPGQRPISARPAPGNQGAWGPTGPTGGQNRPYPSRPPMDPSRGTGNWYSGNQQPVRRGTPVNRQQEMQGQLAGQRYDPRQAGPEALRQMLMRNAQQGPRQGMDPYPGRPGPVSDVATPSPGPMEMGRGFPGGPPINDYQRPTWPPKTAPNPDGMSMGPDGRMGWQTNHGWTYPGDGSAANTGLQPFDPSKTGGGDMWGNVRNNTNPNAPGYVDTGWNDPSKTGGTGPYNPGPRPGSGRRPPPAQASIPNNHTIGPGVQAIRSNLQRPGGPQYAPGTKPRQGMDPYPGYRPPSY